jgi:hypothetical protein
MILHNENLISVRSRIPIHDETCNFSCRIKRIRETNAHLVIKGKMNSCIVAVLESVFSETGRISLDEFQIELAEYFEMIQQINLVIGAYIPYNSLFLNSEFPVSLSMT